MFIFRTPLIFRPTQNNDRAPSEATNRIPIWNQRTIHSDLARVPFVLCGFSSLLCQRGKYIYMFCLVIIFSSSMRFRVEFQMHEAWPALNASYTRRRWMKRCAPLRHLRVLQITRWKKVSVEPFHPKRTVCSRRKLLIFAKKNKTIGCRRWRCFDKVNCLRSVFTFFVWQCHDTGL